MIFNSPYTEFRGRRNLSLMSMSASININIKLKEKHEIALDPTLLYDLEEVGIDSDSTFLNCFRGSRNQFCLPLDY